MPADSPFRTRQELVLEALKCLGIVSTGQPVDPEDYSAVNEKLVPTLRLCAALEIVYVPDPDSIPAVYFSPLADILAGECATKSGVSAEDFMTLTNKGLGGAGQIELGQGIAAKALRAIGRGRPTHEVLISEFF
jgi:hypothetical protein